MMKLKTNEGNEEIVSFSELMDTTIVSVMKAEPSILILTLEHKGDGWE